jgi:hypothetical protein
VIPARRLDPRPTLTRIPLPEDDPTIAALTAEERATAHMVWHGRAESELRAAGSFEYLSRTLASAGAPAELVALARRAVHDEHRHAAICARVAAAFDDGRPPRLGTLPVRVPRHTGASAELEHTLHVVGMCCLNETTGNAFLELCRRSARAPLATAALHELACDEIDHARLGWAFVATRDRETRRALAGWLPQLFAENLTAWRDRPRRPINDALVAHGCPTWEAVDAAVVAAMSELLVPGFALLEIDVAPVQAWLATTTR